VERTREVSLLDRGSSAHARLTEDERIMIKEFIRGCLYLLVLPILAAFDLWDWLTDGTW
jgi:hypothetical protein